MRGIKCYTQKIQFILESGKYMLHEIMVLLSLSQIYNRISSRWPDEEELQGTVPNALMKFPHRPAPSM